MEQEAAREAEPARSALARVLDTGAGRNLGLVAVLVLLCVVGVVTADTFLTTANLLTILTSASIIGVLTVGMTFVIIGGGIDLSVGKVMALASVWATTRRDPVLRAGGDGLLRDRRRRRAAAWSTGCSSPTAGSCRSSSPWRC